MWVARDQGGELYLFLKDKPTKRSFLWNVHPEKDTRGKIKFIEIDSKLFPEVAWQDSAPTRVDLVLHKPKVRGGGNR
jgi:hypothetical protein